MTIVTRKTRVTKIILGHQNCLDKHPHVQRDHLVFVIPSLFVLLRFELMSFSLLVFARHFGCMHLTAIPRMVEEKLGLDGGTAYDAEQDPGA